MGSRRRCAASGASPAIPAPCFRSASVGTGEDSRAPATTLPSGSGVPKPAASRPCCAGHNKPIVNLEFETVGDASPQLGVRRHDQGVGCDDRDLPAAVAGHRGSTETMAFHPDGKTLASAGWGGIYLWDVASGRRTATIHTGHPSGRPFYVAFSPDGKQLAAVGESPLVQVWDTASRKLVRSADLKTASCTAVAFTGDGRDLIIGDGQGYIRIWNVASALETSSFRRPRRDDLRALALAGQSAARDGHAWGDRQALGPRIAPAAPRVQDGEDLRPHRVDRRLRCRGQAARNPRPGQYRRDRRRGRGVDPPHPHRALRRDPRDGLLARRPAARDRRSRPHGPGLGHRASARR